MKRFLILVAVLAIAGCAATSETQIKHGKKGLHINCSGLSSSWDKCYASAANSCAPRDTRSSPNREMPWKSPAIIRLVSILRVIPAAA